MKKIGFWICASIAVLIAGYALFMWLSYISKSITEGSAYGFNIGSSKGEVLNIAKDLYGDKRISLGYNVYDNNDPINKPLDLEKDMNLFFARDEWRFYFEHRNSITFYFDDNSLVRIYRHRQYFEFP